MRVRLRDLSRVERYSFSRHWPAMLSQGLYEGIAGLAAFVAMRSLGAEPWIAPALVVAFQTPWLFSPLWERVVEPHEPRKAFRWLGAAFMVPLLFVAMVEVTPTGEQGRGTGGLGLFVGALVLSQLVQSAAIAHRGALLRTNYGHAVRAGLFGVMGTLSRGASVLSAKVSGLLLDADPRWLRVLFPAAGIFTFVEQLLLARIRWRRSGKGVLDASARRHPLAAFGRMMDVFRADRAFLTFEAAFMLYGFGFLMTTPLLVIFGERDLAVSYGEWTWAYGVAFPAASILALAPAGWLTDRLGAVRVFAISCAALVLFLTLAPWIDSAGQLVAVFIVWGVAMAGIAVVWNVGPLAFAADGRGRAYVGAHVFCVGLRSLLAPPLGYWLAAETSLLVAFQVATVLMTCAGLLALLLHRRLAAAGRVV